MKNKPKNFGLLLITSLLPVVPLHAKYFDQESAGVYYGHRYESPSAGRWISRDAIGERGGKNLYEFALNAPIHNIDALGQLPITSAYICWPKCNGKSYNPLWECCIPNRGVFNRAPAGTGVFHGNYVPQAGEPDWMGHQWVEFGGGSSAGYNYLNNPRWSSPDPMGGNQGPGVTRAEIKLSPCKYDLSQFAFLISLSASVDIGPQPGTYNCGSYVNEILENSREGSKYNPGY